MNGNNPIAGSIDEQTQSCLPPVTPFSHPQLSRYCPNSALLSTSSAPAGQDSISTVDTEIYGNQIHPIAFRIGNGGAGYTKVLRSLCTKFIWTHGRDFRIGWVANHSRHTHAALLGDVVQVALTYEPEWDAVGEREGWTKRVLAPAFWDHFILVGPGKNPAGVRSGCEATEALRAIARCENAVFHTRGDGSATFERERKLWQAASIDTKSAAWLQLRAHTPHAALELGEKESAYLLTDRATFLTAKRNGVVPHTVVYVEGGNELLNPCSALINTRVPDSAGQRMAVQFAEWLGSEQAQALIKGYGRVWELGMPLFTGREQQEFGGEDWLVGRTM